MPASTRTIAIATDRAAPKAWGSSPTERTQDGTPEKPIVIKAAGDTNVDDNCIYHNTFIAPVRWFLSAASNLHFRNNLIMGRRKIP